MRGPPWTQKEDDILRTVVEAAGKPTGSNASPYWMDIAKRLDESDCKRTRCAAFNRHYELVDISRSSSKRKQPVPAEPSRGDDAVTGPAAPSKDKEFTDAKLGDGAYDEGWRIQVRKGHYYIKKLGDSEFKGCSLKAANALRQRGSGAVTLLEGERVDADAGSPTSESPRHASTPQMERPRDRRHADDDPAALFPSPVMVNPERLDMDGSETMVVDGDSGIVGELKGLLGGKSILLYGDSITEELGELYFKSQDISYEFALDKHKEMRGATIEDVKSQVSTVTFSGRR